MEVFFYISLEIKLSIIAILNTLKAKKKVSVIKRRGKLHDPLKKQSGKKKTQKNI